jgi:hypothetical protein
MSSACVRMFVTTVLGGRGNEVRVRALVDERSDAYPGNELSAVVNMGIGGAWRKARSQRVQTQNCVRLRSDRPWRLFAFDTTDLFISVLTVIYFRELTSRATTLSVRGCIGAEEEEILKPGMFRTIYTTPDAHT